MLVNEDMVLFLGSSTPSLFLFQNLEIKTDGEQIALARGSVLKEVVTGKQLRDVKGCQGGHGCLRLMPDAAWWSPGPLLGDAMLVWGAPWRQGDNCYHCPAEYQLWAWQSCEKRGMIWP